MEQRRRLTYSQSLNKPAATRNSLGQGKSARQQPARAPAGPSGDAPCNGCQKTLVQNEKKLIPGVAYPSCLLQKDIFASYATQRASVASADRSTLKKFMTINHISFLEYEHKAIYKEKILKFINAKLKEAVDEEKAAVVEAVPASIENIAIIECLPEVEISISLPVQVDEELLSILPPKYAARYKQMEEANKDEIRDELTHYQIPWDPKHTRADLLEKFYLYLLKLKEKMKDIRSAVLINECCICMEDVISTCLVPCGHSCLCEACSKVKPDLCPVCRASVDKVQPIFFV